MDHTFSNAIHLYNRRVGIPVRACASRTDTNKAAGMASGSRIGGPPLHTSAPLVNVAPGLFARCLPAAGMLASGPLGALLCLSMNNHTNGGSVQDTSLLAREFVKRITQLGMSRRQLTQRTGLSRQTLHNIEHEGRTDLKPATLQALDQGLYWRPGTCLALSQGDASVLDDADSIGQADKESAYRWRIVERIQRMSLGELERMVSMMEGEALGNDVPMSTDDVIATVEANIMQRIERRLALGDQPNNGTATHK